MGTVECSMSRRVEENYFESNDWSIMWPPEEVFNAYDADSNGSLDRWEVDRLTRDLIAGYSTHMTKRSVDGVVPSPEVPQPPRPATELVVEVNNEEMRGQLEAFQRTMRSEVAAHAFADELMRRLDFLNEDRSITYQEFKVAFIDAVTVMIPALHAAMHHKTAAELEAELRKAAMHKLRLIVVGMSASGVSSLLHHQCIRGDYVVQTIEPDTGFQIERLQTPRVQFTGFNFSANVRQHVPYWRHYTKDCHGIIFMVDGSAGPSEIATVRRTLIGYLHLPETRDVPLLVLVNKHDLPGGWSAMDIREPLGLLKIRKQRHWHCYEASCTSRNSEELLRPGIKWIVDMASSFRKNGGKSTSAAFNSLTRGSSISGSTFNLAAARKRRDSRH